MVRLVFIVLVGVFSSVLWDTGLLSPIKLLVVLVHEMWHGFVALCGGALLENIHIDLSEGGETVVSQLNSDSLFVFTVSAGYLGSALTGGLLMSRGLRASYERTGLGLMAACLAYMSYLFSAPDSLAFDVGLGWSIGLGLCVLINRYLARYLLLFLGTIFIWYSLYDLLDFSWNAGQTDAGILARYIFQKDWLLSSLASIEQLTSYISITWSILVLTILTCFFYPMLKNLERRPVIPQKQVEVVDELEMPPKEVDEWLSSKGLRWDEDEKKALPLVDQDQQESNHP